MVIEIESLDMSIIFNWAIEGTQLNGQWKVTASPFEDEIGVEISRAILADSNDLTGWLQAVNCGEEKKTRRLPQLIDRIQSIPFLRILTAEIHVVKVIFLEYV